MTAHLRKYTVPASLALVISCLPGIGHADEKLPVGAVTRLRDVTVTEQRGSTLVRIATAGAAKYRAVFIESPYRLVVDLEDTVYAWRKTPLTLDREPLKQLRGSQYRNGVARIVVEFTRKVGYALLEDSGGLTLVVPTTTLASVPSQPTDGRAAGPPAVRVTVAAMQTDSSSSPLAPPASQEPPPGAPSAREAVPAPANEAAPTEAPSATQTSPSPAPTTTVPRSAPAPRAERAPTTTSQAPPAPTAPVPTAPAPTAPAPPAPTAPPARTNLISLEFKDADVVNLLRTLAVHAGRNIVIGDDVKGKMSISLRQVPWELALDTVLETRGLEKIEKDGVMRIVTREQLTKEREAISKVKEAQIKGEAEARAKLAEAQLKEAEAEIRKLAADASRREQEARGPLREETIRLSYADPEEVAKTLQGILGIPAEGKKVEGPGIIGGPIAEPPFSQLFAPPGAYQPPPTVVSVSQDVLAKGLSIRAHKPTNTLFLRLHQADLERVKKIIKESLDVPLPQVKIEARMEILDRSALEQIGVQWSGAYAKNLNSSTIVGRGLETAGSAAIIPDGIGVTGVTPSNPNLTLGSALPVSAQTGLPLGGNLINLPISALPNAGALPATGLSFGIVGTNWNINLALQALATQGKTRTLARPEVVTVENAKATMSLGEEIPYATVSSAGTQVQFKEALLKLEVTPTVIREGDVIKIKMLVIVENNSRGDVVNLGSAGSPPAINRRKAETQVLIKEGERLIIGGVTTLVNQNTVRKVPIFGDIPLLGYLFKQRENFESGRELVVFLTPTVLKTVDKTVSAVTAPAPK
jgi:type IV pilus secretin PilQ/predicted competence protein